MQSLKHFVGNTKRCVSNIIIISHFDSEFNCTTLQNAVPLTDTFGPGTGPIFFGDRGCIGNETNLDDCPYNGADYDCLHNDVAGVICPQGV